MAQTEFLSGADSAYVAELYARYLQDPGAVDASWGKFFSELGDDERTLLAELNGPSWIEDARAAHALEPLPRPSGNGGIAATTSKEQIETAVKDSIRALMLIRAYRVRGHLMATLDPLGLEKPRMHPELDPATYGFVESDWDRPIFIDKVLGLANPTLRQIMERLRATYCGHIGVEFMHIQEPEQKAWIQERIENVQNQTEFTETGKRAILQRLTAAEGFEHFLQLKYTGTKRFGLDGAEATVPAIEQIIKRGGQLGVKEIVLGMAHRGRLNMLTNVFGKPFSAIFSEFQGNPAGPEDVQGSGDVKYHLGTSSDRDFDGNVIHLSLTANPSHLEAVNPVVEGKVRAKQSQRGDIPERDQVVALLIHGDAAMAGQGLVAETLALSELRGYRTGGTVHFVINNQIGFTTSPSYSRSGPYPTDVAKAVQAPIFHVNGDDPEAVVHVSRIATEFRQRFKKDVVVDMFCYRRFGHNEGDEPAFTQPLMYKAIGNHKSVRTLYAEQLAAEGIITAEEAAHLEQDFQARLESEFEASKAYKPNKADWLEGAWAGFEAASADYARGDTAVPIARLKQVGEALTRVPEGFNLNPKIARQLKAKEQMLATGEGIDWATGEALAFGSLLLDLVPVRLSGQDSGRGTFSQRHAVLYDQETESRHIPLTSISPRQATFEVHDSPLSEAAVLGFEYGYSLADPHALVLWEAQFGDFANGAQVIIDQFVAAGEAKWLRMSGLVLLLPHGYEGQGPEHSSARLERYLQLSAEDNWQVVNCTTPANYFHVLRRQVRRNFRKPLVVMTPKSLLRHKAAVSKLADFGPGSSFHRVLADEGTNNLPGEKVRRVVLCSGKVYYDLAAARAERKIEDIAILRLEQLYPFPDEPLACELAKYPNAEVVWCQEEPENMGAWFFVDRKIERVLGGLKHKTGRPAYVGRPEMAATATGLLRWHNEEQAQLIGDALA
ncbi:MAG TPA: 2-oxoglutarate dehydrogenase E1 component [Alphaproteobacteria bacterium]|nr:2-oxoglutarate dehydrogenase E1 component [Alphaproteobacteria bacterium]